MKYTIAAAAAAVLMLAAPAFAQGAMGGSAQNNGTVAGKTDGSMSSGSAMSSGAGMSGNAMASGSMDKKKKKKASTAMSGSMSGPSGSMSGPAASGGMAAGTH